MSNLENILCCILIPITLMLAYVAGKHDILSMIGEMIEATTKELQEKRLAQKYVAYSFLRDNLELLNKANEQCYLSGFDFSVLMHNFLISEYGYVIDTGNYENVNAEVAV